MTTSKKSISERKSFQEILLAVHRMRLKNPRRSVLSMAREIDSQWLTVRNAVKTLDSFEDMKKEGRKVYCNKPNGKGQWCELKFGHKGKHERRYQW